MYDTLLLESSGPIATITLNRPDKRNAISVPMIADIFSALDAVEKSHARVVILTGAGKAFCAGMDLEMLATIAKNSAEENMEDSRRMARLFRRVWSYSKPLIAAVNGPALAGGCHCHALRFHPRRARSKIRLHGGPDRFSAGDCF